MSIDIHDRLPDSQSRDPAAGDEELDNQVTWAEKTVTVGAIVTVIVVSFVAVLMAMA